MSKTNSRNINELIEYPSEGILSKVLIKSGLQNLTLFCMVAGTDIGEHTSTKEGFVHVLEGKGLFILEGECIEMKPGTIISLKKNAVHSLRADTNMSYLLSLSN